MQEQKRVAQSNTTLDERLNLTTHATSVIIKHEVNILAVVQFTLLGVPSAFSALLCGTWYTSLEGGIW